MKIRTCFVSNSSSSSFLIIFASVDINKSKAIEICQKHKLSILSGKDFKNFVTWDEGYNNLPKKDYVLTKLEEDYVYEMEFHMPILVIPHWEISNDKYYISYKHIGDDGDGWFDGYEKDLNGFHKLPLSWFKQEHQDMIGDICEENGFNNIQLSYGAGRNG
jgi:hypothetical protein